ncbi:hypothetical protein EL26_23810 [Tumebacillus flagellatus]|uniref:Wadjet protein JetD C-terminal domain-containing protein n=1 Tax=Tumebacillus flagellatus TaxID=1157490 RepID=A0A074LLW3_9BACL|nr:hypothetical protein EL26_23810 [Tumebacillus flagellatus]
MTGETIEALEIREIRSSRILLVENLTCYHHVVQESQEGTVVIFAGGFPHRHLQKLLQKLSTFLEEPREQTICIQHWGDLDYGGIRIFEFIRRKLVLQLRPYLMDVATYEEFRVQGISFGKLYERKLSSLLEDGSFAEWHPLVEAILREGYRVEQESLLR